MPNVLQNFFSWVSGKPSLVSPIITSAGAGDQYKIPATDAVGRLSSTFMPIGVAADQVTALAGATLAQYDIVDLWLDTAVLTARKADAGTNKYVAKGFVPDAGGITSAQTGQIQFEGTITVSGPLDMTKMIFSDMATPGGWTQTPPVPVTDTGKMIQKLGFPVSATQWFFQPENPIYL